MLCNRCGREINPDLGYYGEALLSGFDWRQERTFYHLECEAKMDEPKVTAICPKVLEATQATITEAKARGLNVALHCGLRIPEQQDALYAMGRTKPGSVVTNAQGYESWHCLGLAVDIVFRDDKGNWTWNDKCAWHELGATGKIFGFSWGGDWTRFPDLPHFQITGRIPNIREAKEIFFRDGIEKLWSMV